MPRVPMVQGQTVMPTALPATYQRAQATPQAFGAGIGQALERAGGQVDNVAERINRRQVEIQRENDALAAETAYAKFADQERAFLMDPEKGLYSRKGGNALTAYDDAGKWWEENQRRAIEGVENQNQRRLLQSTLSRRRDAALDGVARHVARERQGYMAEAWDSRLKGVIADAAGYYNDPGKVDALIDEAESGTRFWGQRMGQSPEVVDAGAKAARSAIRSSIVDRMSLDSPAAAAAYLEKHKGEMDGLSVARLEKNLKAGVSQEKARNAVREVLPKATAAPGDFEALATAVERVESGGRTEAVSPKGAAGVMQLMPETAREMHGKMYPGEAFDPKRLTADPNYNRTLGRAYLNEMLGRYGGNRTLALAAYNAGPGRVDEWVAQYGDPRTGAVSEADWSARVPFQETRDYLVRVNAAGGTREVRSQATLATARADLQRRFGNDPETLERAETMLSAEYGQQERARAEAERALSDAAMRRLYDTKDVNALTPAELSAIPVEKLRVMADWLERKGRVQTDAETYARLSMMSPEEFEAADLMAPEVRTKLAESDWKRFVDQQRQLRMADDKDGKRAEAAGQRTRVAVVTEALRTAGIDPTPKEWSTAAEKVAAFNRAFDGALAEWRASNPNKRPTDAEYQKIADRLLIRGEVMSGSRWKPDPDKFAFEMNDLPADQRDRFSSGAKMSKPEDKARMARAAGVPVERVDALAAALRQAELPITPDNIAALHKRTSPQ